MKDKNTTRRLVVELPDELLHRAKLSALENRETLRALVERAIERECKAKATPHPKSAPPPSAGSKASPSPEVAAPNTALEDAVARQLEETNKRAQEEHARRVAAGLVPPNRRG